MIYIKPMKKIKTVLCTFGLVVGAIFPIYASFFIKWIPKRKLVFCIGCLMVGYIVNHRYLFDYFERKVSEGIRMMAILFCDIDHFKLVNDTYGHIKGDLVLQEVAKIIRESTNGNEGIFRYGGE